MFDGRCRFQRAWVGLGWGSDDSDGLVAGFGVLFLLARIKACRRQARARGAGGRSRESRINAHTGSSHTSLGRRDAK